MDVVKFTYFLDNPQNPTKMSLMLTPMPTEWSNGFSPLTRIAARLSSCGHCIVDERRHNVIDIEFRTKNPARVSHVIYTFKDAMRDMFNCRIEFFFTKDCKHYNYPCGCHLNKAA